jgi:hypothetical protein
MALLQGISWMVEELERIAQPSIEQAPESLEEWKDVMYDTLQHAKEDGKMSLMNMATNAQEAWDLIEQNTNDVNRQLAEEAQLGLQNLNEMSQMMSKSKEATSSDVDFVTALQNVEKDSLAKFEEVGKLLQDAAKSNHGLESDWASNALKSVFPSAGHEDTQRETENIAVVDQLEESEDSPMRTVFVADNAETGPPRQKRGWLGALDERFQSQSSDVTERVDSTSTQQSTPASQPSNSSPGESTGGDVKDVRSPKASMRIPGVGNQAIDSSLSTIMKGGRHVSILSAPTTFTKERLHGGEPVTSALSKSSNTISNNIKEENDVIISKGIQKISHSKVNGSNDSDDRGGNEGGGSGGGGGRGGGGNGKGRDSNGGGGSPNGAPSWWLNLMIVSFVLVFIGYIVNEKRESRGIFGLREKITIDAC